MPVKAAWLFLLFAVSASAYAQFPERYRLLQSGRFLEVEQLVEKELAGDASPRTFKLYPLCAAYSAIKRYSKLDTCLARLEQNIQRDDVAIMDLDEMRENAGFVLRLALSTSSEEVLNDIRGDVRPHYFGLRAGIASEFGDYPTAIAHLEKALAALPPRINYIGERLTHLGGLAVAQALAGRRDDALKTVAALEKQPLRAAVPGQVRALAWGKRLMLGQAYLALADYRRAHELLVKDDPFARNAIDAAATAILGSMTGYQSGEDTWGSWDQGVAFMQSKIRLEVGELNEAKESYDKLLAQPSVRGAGHIYWTALHDRGRIAAAQGDAAQAMEFWRKAIEVIEEQRSTINTDAGKIGFVGDKQAVYRALVGALVAAGRAREAFEYVERSKARALIDLLAQKKDFAVGGPNAEAIRRLIDEAAASELEAQQRVSVGQQEQKRGSARREFASIREQAPELASLLAVSPVRVEEVQSRLPEDEALVGYYGDESALYAFVLTRASLDAFALSGAGLHDDVRRLRRILENPDLPGHLPIAQALHARLVTPLAQAIAGKRRLLIVPHGILHYLPFAALHDGATYLLERTETRFLPSASVIRHIRPRAGRPGLLAFGNPDLGDPKLDLRFAQEEVVAITKKMPQSRALLRGEASVAAFKQYAGGFGTLHFATHGEFDAAAPLRSALLLAKDAASDGRLTVDTLYSTRIDADLVTLSACETGLGKVASGDDVVGLTRGFLFAGASSVVASLWKVDDRATAGLMEKFYEFAERQDLREALRNAQLGVKQALPHPFYWAAFQLTGETRQRRD